MKFITEEEFMEYMDVLLESFSRLEQKIDDRFDRIDEKFASIDQKFAVIDRNFEKVFQELNYHSSRLKYIEENMVHKYQFNSLVGILERKKVITNFDASHVLYRPSE
ncbi:hypothetical protein IPN41_01790 [Candidatus Falkowbacteria bacterium]|nr:MAG: hypothetical protein IPN41_01790 [Candidatus Falkowbacteria bacterium]